MIQEYFEGNNVDHSSEPPSAKGLAVFRDPLDEKRTATSINWHPDPAAPAKIAVSYSDLTFQNAKFATSRMPQQSFIWDILNPNTPDSELLPPSPLCCLRFNPKNTDSLVGRYCVQVLRLVMCGFMLSMRLSPPVTNIRPSEYPVEIDIAILYHFSQAAATTA
jgi:hypothetical protein